MRAVRCQRVPIVRKRCCGVALGFCYTEHMNDKETIAVLQGLLERGVLTPEESEAVRSAIGVLSWTALAESRIKGLRVKKDRESREMDAM